MEALLYSEITGMCILIALFIYIKSRSIVDIRNKEHLLSWTLIGQMLFFLSDLLWVLVENHLIPGSYYLNWLVNACYFILSGVNGFLWFYYCDSIQSPSSLITTRKRMIIFAMPACLLGLLTLISLKTGWLFYIDEFNVYHRGPLYVIQLICSYGYLLLTSIKSFVLATKATSPVKQREYRNLTLYTLPAVLAGPLQALFQGMPLLCAGIALSLIGVYVGLQEQLISIDSLTQLNNRLQLTKYLSNKLSHPDKLSDLYVLMMDVDNFKKINDKFGHTEGDNALSRAASALKKVCHNTSHFIARFGGDEFVIICQLPDIRQVEELCTQIELALESESQDLPYSISMSIGYAQYTTDMNSMADFISRADKSLYAVKNAKKNTG